jgi:hypothetical protein
VFETLGFIFGRFSKIIANKFEFDFYSSTKTLDLVYPISLFCKPTKRRQGSARISSGVQEIFNTSFPLSYLVGSKEEKEARGKPSVLNPSLPLLFDQPPP